LLSARGKSRAKRRASNPDTATIVDARCATYAPARL
jgi:hypothetical protein